MGACSIPVRRTRGRSCFWFYCGRQYRHGPVIRLAYSRGDFDGQCLFLVRGTGYVLRVALFADALVVGHDVLSIILASADYLKHEYRHKEKLLPASV